MSLKRLGELKDLLLGFDHEPNPILRSLMKKESNVPQGIQPKFDQSFYKNELIDFNIRVIN